MFINGLRTGGDVERQEIPEPGFRVNSGVVRFGADWPGIFFRGDHAGAIAGTLQAIADERDVDDGFAKYLRALSDQFMACQVRPGG